MVTEADKLVLDGESATLTMELQRTRVITAPGVERIPLVDGLFMERWYPVNAVWKLVRLRPNPRAHISELRARSHLPLVNNPHEWNVRSLDVLGALYVLRSVCCAAAVEWRSL